MTFCEHFDNLKIKSYILLHLTSNLLQHKLTLWKLFWFTVWNVVLVVDVRGGWKRAPFRGRRSGASPSVSAPRGMQETHGPARPLQRILRPEEGILKVLLDQWRAVAAQHPGNAAMYPFSYQN